MKVIRRTLYGKAASGGKASGRPVVVRTVADLHLVNDGDVMVAPETQPEFVPAMSRAAAIVTEHGGRFSHAAVWARENRKPAVIQVENASRQLSGILQVAVDGNHGLVAWEDSDVRES